MNYAEFFSDSAVHPILDFWWLWLIVLGLFAAWLAQK